MVSQDKPLEFWRNLECNVGSCRDIVQIVINHQRFSSLSPPMMHVDARGCVFPQELTERILDHLHSDPITLKQCSLVCRSWVPTCRLHIYRNISLLFHQVPRFYEFLSQSPHILPFFQDFRFTNKPGSAEENMLLGKTFQLLAPTVTSVTLLFCQLSVFDNFTTLLGNPPALKSLTIVYSHLVDGRTVDLSEVEDGVRAPRGVSPAQLQTFQFQGPGLRFAVDWYFLPHSTVSALHLRKLSISNITTHEDVTALQRLLRATCHSLECFDFELDESIPIQLDMGEGVNLRCLRLFHAIRGAYPAIQPPLSVIPFLSTVRSSNSLERIVLEITVNRQPELGWRASGWQDLDTTLTQPVFSSLCDVDVWLYWRKWPAKVDEGLAEALERQLPLLSAKEILHIYLNNSCSLSAFEISRFPY